MVNNVNLGFISGSCVFNLVPRAFSLAWGLVRFLFYFVFVYVFFFHSNFSTRKKGIRFSSSLFTLQIVFDAERGLGYDGDIALDEIRLTPGDCSRFVVTSPPPTTTPTPAAKQGRFSGTKRRF